MALLLSDAPGGSRSLRMPGESIHPSCWASAYAMAQRARGTSDQAAVRDLGVHVDPVIAECWPTRTPCRNVRDCESRRKQGSPLLTCAANHPS